MTTKKTGPGRTTPSKSAKTDVEGIHGVEMTAAEVFQRKTPVTFSQPICLDSGLADSRDAARARVQQLEQMANLAQVLGEENAVLGKQLAAARKAAERAEQAAAPATALFVFQAIGRPRFEALIREHPPTQQQADRHAELLKANGRPWEMLGYNPDTFPPALIAAACRAPKLSPSEAHLIWYGQDGSDDDGTEEIPPWSDGECGALFDAALAANRMVR